MLKFFEIRNAKNQFIGVYSAKNAKSAIARAESELNAGTNFFKKSQARISLAGCTATEKKS